MSPAAVKLKFLIVILFVLSLIGHRPKNSGRCLLNACALCVLDAKYYFQSEYTESQRALAADTLAYLTEVDSDLQKTAAISNQLVSALVELLNSLTVSARQSAFR